LFFIDHSLKNIVRVFQLVKAQLKPHTTLLFFPLPYASGETKEIPMFYPSSIPPLKRGKKYMDSRQNHAGMTAEFLLNQVLPQRTRKTASVELGQNACRLGFTRADNPVQTAVGVIFHRLHNFLSGYFRRTVKDGRQDILFRGNLTLAQGDII
jgi:hypothetical protein